MLFKLAVRNGVVGKLHDHALPKPEHQNHHGKIPKGQVPLRRLGFKLPFRRWTSIHTELCCSSLSLSIVHRQIACAARPATAAAAPYANQDMIALCLLAESHSIL